MVIIGGRNIRGVPVMVRIVAMRLEVEGGVSAALTGFVVVPLTLVNADTLTAVGAERSRLDSPPIKAVNYL
jgi:hypothetical protein